MLSSQSVTNEKPRDLAATKSQGTSRTANVHSDSTPMLKDSKSRYEKGMGYINPVGCLLALMGSLRFPGFR
ncbi:MAG: hypothetical protein ACM3SR_02810 [Ignavibacteriales bacterium]